METSPQKENGFTPIANEILEALARTKFTELETQALFLIFRNTYGWNRKVWEIRRWKVFEQIGITPNRIKDTLYKLADRNIIHLDWQAKTISFQKDYSIWQSLLSTKKIKTKLKNQGIIKDKKVDESVNFEKLTNRSSKSCPIGQVGVDESVNFGSCKPNGDIALPEPKERSKENIYIYNEKARELRAVISTRYSIPFENKDMPTIQFMIDLLKLYDYEYIEKKIAELPNPLEYKDISRTLRSWCEHPEKSKPEPATPYKDNTKEAFLAKRREVEERKAELEGKQ